MKNILIVEDDKALSNGIKLALQTNDTIFQNVYDIKSAKLVLQKIKFDLIILDINLPDGNGFDLLQQIKNEYNIPIIILTANDLEIDIVSGLEMGASDYITKPFSLAILRARVNIQFRKQVPQNKYEQDKFIFDFGKFDFYKNNVLVELSKMEQRLLKILIDNRGIIIERATLLDKI